jgi:hypothetical protein
MAPDQRSRLQLADAAPPSWSACALGDDAGSSSVGLVRLDQVDGERFRDELVDNEQSSSLMNTSTSPSLSSGGITGFSSAAIAASLFAQRAQSRDTFRPEARSAIGRT